MTCYLSVSWSVTCSILPASGTRAERTWNEGATKEERRTNGERTEIYRTSIENRTEAPLSNHGAKITNRQASMRQYYAMVRHSAPFWVVLWFSKLLIRSGRLAMGVVHAAKKARVRLAVASRMPLMRKVMQRDVLKSEMSPF